MPLPVAPRNGYPEFVDQAMNKLPPYEYYEPPRGHQWGSVPSTAIYPFEVDEDKKYVYFRNTAPPNSPVQGQKYVVFYYDSPKSGIVRVKDHKLVFVPYLLLVDISYAHAIANFVNIPVFNPSIRKSVTIRAVRRYKKPLKAKRKKKAQHSKKGGGKETQSNAGPKNKAHKSKKGEKSKKHGEEEDNEDDDSTGGGDKEEKWRQQLDNKTKAKNEAKKFQKARKYARTHIDYWRAFGDRAKPNYRIYDNHQARHIMNGGYDIGVKVSLDYVKPEDINQYNLQNSIMFPPTYTNDADMPAEAMIDYMDLQDSLIARIQPPYPMVKAAKYTFFYIAPANFKYHDGRKIWIPVYILVPKESKEKPTNMKIFHSYKVKEAVDKDSVYIKAKQKAVWTSRKFSNMLMNKKFVNIPQKPLESTYFVKPKEFHTFLNENGLINEGVHQDKKKERKFESRDPIKIFLKNVVDLLNMKTFQKKDLMADVASGNEAKFKKIMKVAKDQRMSLLDDLKRKNALKRNLMKQRVMEMNRKLKGLKKIYKAQKEKMKEMKIKNDKKKKGKSKGKGKKDKKGKKGKKKKDGKSKKKRGKKHRKKKKKHKKKKKRHKSKKKHGKKHQKKKSKKTKPSKGHKKKAAKAKKHADSKKGGKGKKQQKKK